MGFLTNLKWRAIQLLFKIAVPIIRFRWFSPTTQPDLCWRPSKRYLYPGRVFMPRDVPKGQKDLPLLIDVHGGGFVANIPAIDDPVCRYLADHGRCVVVSIDYRKAPQNPFPSGYEDVVEQISVLIASAYLDIDRKKVMLIGSSAGGNLVLAAAQDERLRGRILGVMALYPVTDCSIGIRDKMASRPDTSVPDLLETSYDEIQEAYLSSDAGARNALAKDVRASPGAFAKREDLPEHVYLIGAEHDLLSHEAEVMAERLAEGVEKVTQGNGWRAGGIRWENVKGETHGFDVFGRKGETREQKVRRMAARDGVYGRMATWISEIAVKHF